MFCRKCGNELSDEALFCTQCGSPCRETPAHTPSEQENADKADRVAASFATAVDGAKRRSRRQMPTIVLVALALALLSGLAYAAYVVYKEISESQMQDETAVEQPSEDAEEAESDDSANEQETESDQELEYGYETVEMQTTMPYEPILDPGGTTTATWSYPRITCTQNNEYVDRINERLESDVKQRAADSETWTMDGAHGAQCLDLQYAVTYQEESIVSIRQWRYETLWGPHGNHYVFGATYDLSTGEPINPGSIFGLDRQQTIDLAAEAVRSFIQNNPDKHNLSSGEAVQNAITDISSRIDCMYLTSEGLVVHSQDYDLGGWSPYYEIIVKPFDDTIAAGTISRGTNAQSNVLES